MKFEKDKCYVCDMFFGKCIFKVKSIRGDSILIKVIYAGLNYLRHHEYEWVHMDGISNEKEIDESEVVFEILQLQNQPSSTLPQVRGYYGSSATTL